MEQLNHQSTTGIDPGDDCREALSLGTEQLAEMKLDPTQYKLIAARNLVTNSSFAGPQVWQLTFKLRSLIPEDPDSEIGAGGEVFIDVDLSSGQAKLRGYGE